MKTYPVIHFSNRELALEQVALAQGAGASGVFLISHYGNDAELVNVACEAKQLHPDFAIGINLLSKAPLEAARRALEAELDMVWADSMGVDSRGLRVEGSALAELAKTNPRLQFFASVAFKYREPEFYPALAAQEATKAGFIATTSGAATGSAPEVSKIASMFAAAGGRLAVASGMTPENVSSFVPFLSHILVATGVSIDEFRIDEAKLKLFIANVEVARATGLTDVHVLAQDNAI